MCGPEQFLSEEDPEEVYNRRLMLGEEEELPPGETMPTQRGPYMCDRRRA